MPSVAMYVQFEQVGIARLQPDGVVTMSPHMEAKVRGTFPDAPELGIPTPPAGDVVTPQDGERYLDALCVAFRSGVGTACAYMDE